MGQVPNTTDAEQFTNHPQGWFGFIVKEARDTDENGAILMRKDGTELALVILQPDFGSERPDMRVWFTLAEPFLWKLKEFQVACGMPTSGGYTWDHFVGKKVRAEVVWNKSKDKTYANVNAWEPYQEAGAGTKSVLPSPSPDDSSVPF